MPAGDRKVARALRQLALELALASAHFNAKAGSVSCIRGLSGGELARYRKAITDGQLPEVKVRVTFVKLNAGKVQ